MSEVILYNKKEMTQKKGKRTRYTFNNIVNLKGETLSIELSNCKNDGSNSNIINLWLKHGYITKPLNSFINVDVSIYDNEGYCWNKYNPQIIEGTHKINFNWIFEDTKQNRMKLIEKIYNNFMEV